MRLHYHVDGPRSAPALVLSGSLGTTLAMWEPQLAALAERFRVVRYDHPGHGGSQVPAGPVSIDDFGRGVVELLDALDLDRAAFCGLSLGGIVGMWLGSRVPERLTRLALASTAACFPPRARWDERIAIARRDGVESIADSVLERWFTPRFRERGEYRRMLVSIQTEGYARGCEVVRDADLRDSLGSIAVPTLVLAGADDPAVSADDVRGLADGIPETRVVELAGAAHLANVEQPEAFTEALLEHLGATARA
jgi:3-oxoadipate enol-lactonase